ncbi:MAG: 30S ribosomal protein S8 [Candidatus Pacebacteria bacterium]|nr:30S ribosomal protein S8 [Candidatus Paceibacterota bacterium]
MLINDPISDLLIRLKNAFMSEHEQVAMPHSKLKEAVAKLLKEHHYITDYQVTKKKPQSELVIELRYIQDQPAITRVKRISKSSRRVYAPADKLPLALKGYGLTIVSTNQGLMSAKKARKQNLGGEVMCQVW